MPKQALPADSVEHRACLMMKRRLRNRSPLKRHVPRSQTHKGDWNLKLNCMNPQPKLIYKIGDLVRIRAGPFANFTGRVDGINQSKSLLKVAVDTFGRVTPVKVNFSEAEKLEVERPLPPRSNQN